MKAKLIRMEGTIEAEGTPEELARLFKDFAGLGGWTQASQLPQGFGTLAGGVQSWDQTKGIALK